MVTGLGLLVLLTAGSACRSQDAMSTEPSHLAVTAGSVTLTYICGNTFRVRNTNATAVNVRWDVYGTTETGTLTLPPKPEGASYSETYFTTTNNGTVRLFEGTTLLQTKANGNKPSCTVGLRPAIPDQMNPDDAEYLVEDPRIPGTIYYRRQSSVMFTSTATDQEVAAFFSRFGAVAVGGDPSTGEYYIQFPDPGSNWASLDSLLTVMKQMPGVLSVMELAREVPKGPLEGRYPNDGSTLTRDAWFDASSRYSWALRAIRAPLAWGCETGDYGSEVVSVAVLEHSFEADSDLAGSRVTRVRAPNPAPNLRSILPQSEIDLYQWHGKAVASALTATGDNGRGVAGAVWRSALTVYEITPPSNSRADDVQALQRFIVSDISRRQPRVLSISAEMIASPNRRDRLRLVFERILDRVPGLLIVKAAGDSGKTETLDQVVTGKRSVRSVLAELAQGTDSQRILFVSGTQEDGSAWPGSDWITGVPTIAAPAASVAVLGLSRGGTTYSGNVVLGEGTSFAAPLVAGIAAQLLAMEPSLSPSTVRDLILRGARVPRESGTGAMIDPVVVPGRSAYLADAYGALQLLSKERDGTPLCGVDVQGAYASDGSYHLSAQRNNPQLLLTLPAASNAWTFSVAQGGRKLAVDGYDRSLGQYQSFPFQLSDGRWQAQAVQASVARLIYLETDTAYFSFQDGANGNFDLWLRILSPRSSRNFGPQGLTVGLPGTGSIWNWNANYINATGDFALIEWRTSSADCTFQYSLYALRTRPTLDRTIIAQGCRDESNLTTTTAWSGNGRDLLTVQSQGPQGSVQFTRWRVGTWNMLASATEFSGSRVEDAAWSPEGGRVTLAESQANASCQVTVRSALNPLSQVEAPRAVAVDECRAPVRQSLPALRQHAASGSGQLDASTSRDWRRGPPRVASMILRSN